ncbi:sodium-dependent proline transporter-like [Hemicordylus capensis]|uniref:sodium-dependent proline transporter-like n=1 Tax=Hemicordylus capensis TaxID=884348 RepID=UPI0023024EF3|nr:sodium-dependent proline transporter-like [Hemicordylus capensis]
MEPPGSPVSRRCGGGEGPAQAGSGRGGGPPPGVVKGSTGSEVTSVTGHTEWREGALHPLTVRPEVYLGASTAAQGRQVADGIWGSGPFIGVLCPASQRPSASPSQPQPVTPAPEPSQPRETWGGKYEFLLSCIGYCVGLGNVWRFPYLCYRNGGGVFLIPLAVMLLFAGLPLFLMELSLGQYGAAVPITVWKCCPLLKGIGFAMLLVSSLVSLYYNVIIAWTFDYLGTSWQSPLPWSCGAPQNAHLCQAQVLPDPRGQGRNVVWVASATEICTSCTCWRGVECAGVTQFCQDIVDMIRCCPPWCSKLVLYFKACWVLFTPGLLLFILFYIFLDLSSTTLHYGKYEYPPWGEALGVCMGVVTCIQIPLWATIALCKESGTLADRFSKAIRPLNSWRAASGRDTSAGVTDVPYTVNLTGGGLGGAWWQWQLEDSSGA